MRTHDLSWRLFLLILGCAVRRSEAVDTLAVGQGALLSGWRNVLANVHPNPSLFSPNEDGVNDTWELAYDLLVVTGPARVQVAVYDLAGRRVCLVYVGEQDNGHHIHAWDGRDEQGRRVAPGLYVYRMQVEADARNDSYQGVVGVGR